MSKSGDMNFQFGRNNQQGKRKRGFNPSMAASKLSRRLFFKGRKAPFRFTPMDIDKQVGKSLKNRLIQMPEQKVHEVQVTEGAVSTTNVINLLNGLQTGDTAAIRTGGKVRITKIQVLGDIRLSTTATNGTDRGKLTLYIDKQTNGAAGLYSTDTDASSLYTPASYPFFKTNAWQDAYYVIRELDWVLDANYSGQQNTFNFKWDVPIDRIIHYNSGNAGTVADIVTNAFYLGYRGSIAAGAAASGITFRSRIYYTDS